MALGSWNQKISNDEPLLLGWLSATEEPQTTDGPTRQVKILYFDGGASIQIEGDRQVCGIDVFRQFVQFALQRGAGIQKIWHPFLELHGKIAYARSKLVPHDRIVVPLLRVGVLNRHVQSNSQTESEKRSLAALVCFAKFPRSQ